MAIGNNTSASYTVKPGDTLSRIAMQFHVPLTEILRANPRITNPNFITVGQSINLRAGHAGNAGQVPTNAAHAPHLPTPLAPQKPHAPHAIPPWFRLAKSELDQWNANRADERWKEERRQTYCGPIGLSTQDQWCSAFANWIMRNSMHYHGSGNALAGSWMKWSGGKISPPRKGAIALRLDYSPGTTWCDIGHVTFLHYWNADTVGEPKTYFDQMRGEEVFYYPDILCQVLGGNQGAYHEVTESNFYGAPNYGCYGWVFIWPKLIP